MKFPIYGKIKFMFQTTNQYCILRPFQIKCRLYYQNLCLIHCLLIGKQNRPVAWAQNAKRCKKHQKVLVVSLLAKQKPKERLFSIAETDPTTRHHPFEPRNVTGVETNAGVDLVTTCGDQWSNCLSSSWSPHLFMLNPIPRSRVYEIGYGYEYQCLKVDHHSSSNVVFLGSQFYLLPGPTRS